jgi:hypothetical protein
MSLCLEAARKPKFLERIPKNNSSPRASTINVIESVLSVPSLLRAHPLIDPASFFPRSMQHNELMRANGALQGSFDKNLHHFPTVIRRRVRIAHRIAHFSRR